MRHEIFSEIDQNSDAAANGNGSFFADKLIADTQGETIGELRVFQLILQAL